MPTHGERIVKLETIIELEIPAIKNTIDGNHKEIKKNIDRCCYSDNFRDNNCSILCYIDGRSNMVNF